MFNYISTTGGSIWLIAGSEFENIVRHVKRVYNKYILLVQCKETSRNYCDNVYVITSTGIKIISIYFERIDLIYDKSNPDFEDRCCHVIYDDDDAEDFSFSEFLNAKNFFKQSTVIGVNWHTQLFNYVYLKHACLK